MSTYIKTNIELTKNCKHKLYKTPLHLAGKQGQVCVALYDVLVNLYIWSLVFLTLMMLYEPKYVADAVM